MSRNRRKQNGRNGSLPEDSPQNRIQHAEDPHAGQPKRNSMNSKHSKTEDATPEGRDEALTRLLLDEVDTDERVALEVLIETDPAARRTYEERRAAIELLRSGGMVHDSLRLSSDRRAGIFAAGALAEGADATGAGAEGDASPASITPLHSAARSPSVRPQGWFAYSGVAAALLLAGIWLCFLPDEGVSLREGIEPRGGTEKVYEISGDRDAVAARSNEEQRSREEVVLGEPGPEPLSIEGGVHVQKTGLATLSVEMKNTTPVEGIVIATGTESGAIRVDEFGPVGTLGVIPSPSKPFDLQTEEERSAMTALFAPTQTFDWNQGLASPPTPSPESSVLSHAEGDLKKQIAQGELRIASLETDLAKKKGVLHDSSSVIAQKEGPIRSLDAELARLEQRAREALVRAGSASIAGGGEREKEAVTWAERAQLDHQELEEQLAQVQGQLAFGGDLLRLDMANSRGLLVDALGVQVAPQVDGVVVAVRDGIVVLSVGRDDNVEAGQEFTIFDGDRFVAQVKVENVLGDMSGARVLFTQKGESIQPGAKASTRLTGGGSSAPPSPALPSPLEKFPQIDGTLASVQEGFVVLAAGKTKGVRDGASFDLVDGDRVVGRVKVLRAHDDLAACEVTTLVAGTTLTDNLTFRAVPDPAAIALVEELELARQAQLEREREAKRQANEQRLYTLLSSCERRPRETPGQMYFRFWGDNPFVRADLDPLSTFGMDVDTASHAIVRRYLREGRLPPRAAVRTEEWVNAYPSGLPAPTDQDLGITLELAESPFSNREGVALLKVGIKAREVSGEERKPIALTFVIDTSGSMKGGNRLELVKQAILTLLPELDERDTIGIVAFSSTGRVVLEPVSALEVDAIGAALLTLVPDGSTNVQQGLDLGYAMAERQFREASSNRVALFSDGVANTGVTHLEALLDRTAEARARGIDFNSFGVGMGNHNDALLEQLADRGDGICVYLDTLKEAQKYFREQLAGTFQTVARDAKIQVEFHPGSVVSYRQIGYENRAIADQDFRNDAVDGGEVGAGHEVVALYEVELKPNLDGPIATARVRYRSADHDEVVEIEKQATDALLNEFLTTSDHFRLSATVAAFAEILRDSTWTRRTTLAEVEAAARTLTHLDSAEEGTPVADLLVMIEQSKGLVAQRILSDLDRLLDEVKRNQHLRARIEDRLGERVRDDHSSSSQSAPPSAHDPLRAELDRLRAQHDELEQRLRKLLVG